MKFNSILFLLLVTIFVSCKKDNTNVQEDLSKSINSLKYTDVRRLAFSELSPHEKSEFVASRVEQAIIDLKLNDEQIAVTREMLAYIEPELFEAGSEQKKKILEFEKTWAPRAEKLFTPLEFQYIFSSMLTFEEYKLEAKSIEIVANAGEEAGKPDCDCNSGSYTTDCKSGYHCDKDNKDCIVASWSCGLFYLSDCTNRCIKNT